ncbi:MAG: DUF2147 domain-containing protein [Rhodobacteraceae bacterium]|nr:DUF2147 domain-containing protein [Paracoccaceae bacterium]
MKRLALTAVLAILVAAPAFAADPVEGMWQTKPDDNGNFGYIQVQPCGTKFCGTLVKSFDKDGKPMQSDNVGKQIVWDMVAEGNGAYGEGKVWSPDRNKTYNSKMKLTGDNLAVSGCVFFICRDGGTWTRVKN